MLLLLLLLLADEGSELPRVVNIWSCPMLLVLLEGTELLFRTPGCRLETTMAGLVCRRARTTQAAAEKREPAYCTLLTSF